MCILTDANGRPFEKPEPPSKGCTIDETIAYLRACHAYQDAIADCASRGFATAFTKGLR